MNVDKYKEALNNLKVITLSHVEQITYEMMDGYTEDRYYEEYDGTIEDNYPEWIRALEEAIDLLERKE